MLDSSHLFEFLLVQPNTIVFAAMIYLGFVKVQLFKIHCTSRAVPFVHLLNLLEPFGTVETPQSNTSDSQNVISKSFNHPSK
jgi:hypothetical protein